MKSYEAPTLTPVGTVADLTQGQVFQQGQDSLSWIPIFGGNPRPGGGHGGGSGGGGGFGS